MIAMEYCLRMKVEDMFYVYLRRAVRHARLLGIEKMFLVPMVDVVIAYFC